MTCRANFLIGDKHGREYRTTGYYWGDGAFWCASPDDRSEGLYTSPAVEWADDPTRLFRAGKPPVDENGLKLLSKYRILRVMLDPRDKTRKNTSSTK